MQAIYASKMYRASKNKDKIKAALKDPMNAELVTQLKSYLDKEYQQPKYVDPDSAEPDKEPKDRPEETIIPSEHSSGGGGGFSGGSGGMDHHLSDSLKDDEFGEFDDSMPAEPSGDDESGSDEEVAESTKVKKTAVKAGTCVVTNSADEADSIKGMLNSRDDCAGVVRIIVKDDEMWIHYNDDTNLNNVMEPVIYVLNAADYSHLQFNRLARTENAIVFSIENTSSQVEPLEESNE